MIRRHATGFRALLMGFDGGLAADGGGLELLLAAGIATLHLRALEEGLAEFIDDLVILVETEAEIGRAHV